MLFNAEKYEVLRSLDECSILARKLHTQQVQRLFNNQLQPAVDFTKQQSGKTTDLVTLSEKTGKLQKSGSNLFLYILTAIIKMTV